MQFKIRCSAIGIIMTDHKNKITSNQLKEIDQLCKKDKLTEKQQLRLGDLIYKRDNMELSQTTKSYCEDWLKSKIYNRKLEFTSKYTDKGIIMEDESIDFLSEKLGLGMLFKNEKYYENDYMIGTDDIEIPDLIIDTKNSWSWETFPYFDKKIPNSNYEWQLQGYMELTGKRKAKLIYVLSNTPQHLIEREARNYCYYNGYDQMDMEIYNKFHEKLTYDDLPDELKIKIYNIDYDPEMIKKIKLRVNECREYINLLIKENNIKWPPK